MFLECLSATQWIEVILEGTGTGFECPRILSAGKPTFLPFGFAVSSCRCRSHSRHNSSATKSVGSESIIKIFLLVYLNKLKYVPEKQVAIVGHEFYLRLQRKLFDRKHICLGEWTKSTKVVKNT